MKIRFVMRNLYGAGGGVGTVVRNLAQALGQRHEVELISLMRPHDDPVHAPPPGIPLRFILDRRDDSTQQPSTSKRETAGPYERYFKEGSLYRDERVCRYIGSIEDGAVIGMNPEVNLLIGREGHHNAIKVAQDHRTFRSHSALFRDASRVELTNIDAMLTLTKADRRKYRGLFDGRPPVHYMPNGTPPYLGPKAVLEAEVVTAAGHLSRGKGFDRLINAWVDVHQKYPDWQLRIFGQGALQAALQTQIDELGLGDCVTLMGYSTNLREEIAASSMFVLSSRLEGYGMVLVEAMSCGVPVVSFDCPSGPRTIIRNEKDGFLIPNDDIPALTEGIVRMIELGDVRKEMGQAALKRANKRNQEAVAVRWEKLLYKLQAAKRVK